MTKHHSFLFSLAIGLAPLVPDVGRAQESMAPSREGISAAAADVGVKSLVDQIDEFARAPLPRAKKEKLISAAVRDAVTRATRAGTPGEAIAIAMELTVAAARTAPEFADEIARSAAFAGAIARQPGAGARLRTAVYKANRHAAVNVSPRVTGIAPNFSSGAGVPASSLYSNASGAPALAPADGSAAAVSASHRSSSSFSAAESLRISLTGAVAVSYDDNVYLRSKDEVDETIVSATPGIAIKVGNNSLAHASAAYGVALTRYVNGSAENARLGTGTAEAGYDNGRVAVRGSAVYQQVDQNSRDVSSVAGNSIVRRHLFNADVNAESALTAKTSASTGIGIAWQEYKRAGLLGSKNITVPVRLYVATGPNLAISTGVSYSQVKPQGGGPEGRDFFYNIGLRGSLTAKLSANLSAGYRTRAVANSPTEGLWGFDGVLNYAATPKTDAALLLSRNFGTSALGNSVTNSSYFLTFNSKPTLQWQLSGTIGHRTIDYGENVFAPNSRGSSDARKDDYWETSLNAGYTFSSLMSANTTWTHRRNRSSESDAEFSNNILSLVLQFQY